MLKVVLSLLSMFLIISLNVQADEENNGTVIYDLAAGGRQTFNTFDSMGNSIEVTVSEENPALFLCIVLQIKKALTKFPLQKLDKRSLLH